MGDIKQDFLEIVQIMEGMQRKFDALEHTNQMLIRANRQMIDWVQDISDEIEDYKENAVFELSDEWMSNKCFWYPRIRSGNKAISEILVHRKSLSRFGDGEFSVIAGRLRHKFQTQLDETLAQRLCEVLASKKDELLIGIADNYGSLERYTAQAKREIRRYLKRSVRWEQLALLDPDRIYYDAYVTRPYVMYADNQTDAPKRRFLELKKIWQDRDCVFVEGKHTALGIGNDLFKNAGSIRRILAPAQNAFDSYQAVYERCLQEKENVLFLLALGPTATVLAYDLCQAGYQAIDVGHIDLEYEWFLRGEGCRTIVVGKYNNEINGGQEPEKIVDKEYLNQIIADFSRGHP